MQRREEEQEFRNHGQVRRAPGLGNHRQAVGAWLFARGSDGRDLCFGKGLWLAKGYVAERRLGMPGPVREAGSDVYRTNAGDVGGT